jgi:D-alanyl-D-alanine carboxypeptidase
MPNHLQSVRLEMTRHSLRLVVLAATVALAHGLPGAQTAMPDTPAARQFSAWLEPFNAADRAAMQRFIQERYVSPGNRTVDQELAFRKQTGGFELMKVEDSTPTRVSGLVKERDSDQFGRFTVEVEPMEPHRIVRFGVQAIPRPAEFAIARLSEADLTAALTREIDKRAAADQFAGAVLVAKNGKTIFSGAYGLADRERTIPNRMDTRFRNGSMNKMFTAVATLTLVQAGKLAVDDPIAKHLPDYPNKTLASKVTIHHLLTHTGGTGDIFGPQFTGRRLELRTHQDYLNLYGARDLAFEPGSRWLYSNYGFVLLGALIEKVSGQSYYDYVRDHVYKPAGMTATGSEPEDQAVANRSIGYMRRPGSSAWQPNTDTLPYRGMAAGGGYTTVEDLLRFAQALKNHTLLDPRHTDLLITGKVDAGGGRYAYGFNDRVAGGVRSVGHGGGAPGMNGDLFIYPDSGYVVAVLANMDPPAAQRISDFIANRLPQR